MQGKLETEMPSLEYICASDPKCFGLIVLYIIYLFICTLNNGLSIKMLMWCAKQTATQ